MLPMITRSAAGNANPPLLAQAPANVAMQNYMRQKTRSAKKKVVGELSAKAKSVTNRLKTPKTAYKKGGRNSNLYPSSFFIDICFINQIIFHHHCCS